MSKECVHIYGDCIQEGYKCSECPISDLACDEFYKAIEVANNSGLKDGYAKGKKDGEKETIEGILTLIDKACMSFKILMDKSYSLINDDASNITTMHLQAIAYFQQRYETYQYEFKSLIQNYKNGERGAEQ